MEANSSQNDLRLEEFSRNSGDTTLFFQILHLDKSAYIWIGTDENNLSSLVVALAQRGNNDPSVTSLLGASGVSTSPQLVEHLQKRLGINIILSANLPETCQMSNVEEILIDHFLA